jgi:hypothetical protein
MGAMFQLTGGGVGVMPDPDDNPDQHVVPHHDAGTMVSFTIVNVGDAGGQGRVGVEIDDVFVEEWQSGHTDPGGEETGKVRLGRLTQGDHTALTFVNPGSGIADHETNSFGVE